MPVAKNKPVQKGGGRPSKVSLQRAQQSLNDRQVMYVAWEATPKRFREPKSRSALSKELGVNEVTLWRWAKDPKVQQAVRWMTMHHAGDPARVSRVIDFIVETVEDETQTRRLRLEAARDFLRAVGVYQTFKEKPELLTTKDVSEIQLDELSDDEVWDLYNERAGGNGPVSERVGDNAFDVRALDPPVDDSEVVEGVVEGSEGSEGSGDA